MKIFAIAFLAMIIATLPSWAKERVTCKSFATYAEALQVYTRNKKQNKAPWKSLDRDNDGRPCECLPGSPDVDRKACLRKKTPKN